MIQYTSQAICVQKNGHLAVAVQMVEAAGQLIHLFRGGLDYAFIPVPAGAQGAGRVIRTAHVRIPDPSVGSLSRVSRSMSLYRAA